MEKRICILYTGGTIGMVPSEKGYVPSSGAFLDLLRAIPDLYWADMPRWDVVEFDPLLDSSDITVREWNQIGRAIAARYDDYDGFVVLHGTDTMAYSASAISFMLENLSKPVIFTGSQIPLGQIRSDGRDNIISSLLIAASGQVHEVCIYFNGVLLRGNRSTKRSSDQFEAFESPNDAPLAHAGIQIEYKKRVLRPASSEPFRLQPFKELPIGVIKIFPGIQFDYFESLMTDKLKGVVLETFGAGNIPGSAQNALLKILEEPPDYGVFLILTANAEKLLATIRSRCAELKLSPLTPEEALPALRKQFPERPDEELRAALLRAGGYLGQAAAQLTEGLSEHTAAFAAAYAARDTLGLLGVLLPMEKLRRDQLSPILEQWRTLLADALAAKSGLPAALSLTASVCKSRTGAELLAGVQALQTAIDDLNANVGPGPIVGWLTIALR